MWQNSMVKKIKSCVLISGDGTNLESLIRSSRDYSFPIKIELIISNNIYAKGLNLAKKYSIAYKYFSSKNIKKFERLSLREINKKKIKFLCLAGFMKVLSNNFINSFNHKIVNIHPSLLPKFKGLNTHKRVLKSNEKYSGCTVHYVTSKLDSGKIILQKKILITKHETESSLRKKILIQEHKLYSKSIISVFR
jgi:phosphoribosylglycinamide formyltransferase 1